MPNFSCHGEQEGLSTHQQLSSQILFLNSNSSLASILHYMVDMGGLVRLAYLFNHVSTSLIYLVSNFSMVKEMFSTHCLGTSIKLKRKNLLKKNLVKT